MFNEEKYTPEYFRRDIRFFGKIIAIYYHDNEQIGTYFEEENGSFFMYVKNLTKDKIEKIIDLEADCLEIAYLKFREIRSKIFKECNGKKESKIDFSKIPIEEPDEEESKERREYVLKEMEMMEKYLQPFKEQLERQRN